MKKLLIIKDGLKTGGTTSSFFSFLQALAKLNAFQIDVWVHEGRAGIALPAGVRSVENKELEKAFFRPTKKFAKIIDYVKNGQLFLYAKAKRLKRKGAPHTLRIPVAQKMDIRKAKKLGKISLESYDIVVTWEELYPLYVLSEAIIAKKKLAFIHPNYKSAGFHSDLDESSFKKLDGVVAVSKKGAEDLATCFPALRDRFFAARNRLTVEDILQKSREDISKELDSFGKGITLVTVSRLQNVSKALDRALRIAARLRNDGISFRWFFVGDGEDRGSLEALAAEYRLEEYVRFVGEKENPYPYVKNADLFVLQSYYEGMPVVVDEALLLGTPVFVSEYGTAAEQVDTRYGVVAKNREETLFEELKALLQDTPRLAELRENLRNVDRARYESGEEYRDIIERIIEQ